MSSPARQSGEDRRTCSVLSASVHESAYGTASPAVAWVGLEQRGPWGHDAVRQSHLDADLGDALGESLARVGGRFALIRRPGAHADDHRLHSRAVLVASCMPGREWLLTGTVVDVNSLSDLDVAALARGDRGAVLASLPALAPEPREQLLVCTNGRRDVCCAVRGRPVADGTTARHPGQVWETSHTGGHRFAPTGLLLPSGITLGRLTVRTAAAALASVSRLQFPLAMTGPRHDRGRCGLSPRAQVAESAVRHQIAERGLNALRVAAAPGGSADSTDPVTRWSVEHADGRRWQASVREVTSGAERPVSCGREPEPVRGYDVRIISG